VRPWLPPEPQEKPESEPQPEPLWEIHDRLRKKCGSALYTISETGRITLNQNYIIQYFCLRNDIIFEQDEKRFYLYQKTTGAWHFVQRGTV
jgi:hypothetical protein